MLGIGALEFVFLALLQVLGIALTSLSIGQGRLHGFLKQRCVSLQRAQLRWCKWLGCCIDD